MTKKEGLQGPRQLDSKEAQLEAPIKLQVELKKASQMVIEGPQGRKREEILETKILYQPKKQLRPKAQAKAKKAKKKWNPFYRPPERAIEVEVVKNKACLEDFSDKVLSKNHKKIILRCCHFWKKEHMALDYGTQSNPVIVTCFSPGEKKWLVWPEAEGDRLKDHFNMTPYWQPQEALKGYLEGEELIEIDDEEGYLKYLREINLVSRDKIIDGSLSYENKLTEQIMKKAANNPISSAEDLRAEESMAGLLAEAKLTGVAPKESLGAIEFFSLNLRDKAPLPLPESISQIDGPGLIELAPPPRRSLEELKAKYQKVVPLKGAAEEESLESFKKEAYRKIFVQYEQDYDFNFYHNLRISPDEVRELNSRLAKEGLLTPEAAEDTTTINPVSLGEKMNKASLNALKADDIFSTFESEIEARKKASLEKISAKKALLEASLTKAIDDKALPEEASFTTTETSKAESIEADLAPTQALKIESSRPEALKVDGEKNENSPVKPILGGAERFSIYGKFTQEQNHALFRTLSILCPLLLISFALNLYLFFSLPNPKYFAVTSDLRVLELPPLNEPVIENRALANWTAEVVSKSMSLNFLTWRRTLADIRSEFENQGFDSFLKSLDNGGHLEKIEKERLSLSCVLNGAPVVVSQERKDGAASWKLEMPLILSYESSSGVVATQNLLAEVVVRRVKTTFNPKGVAISQIVLTKKG
ncbi:MAG: DotI/IcmL/TraM family protein [Deltaproteobacteria bacterium]|jgi:intracellular multiplication protein IcmL|nr:DotI/IcmL/TraM family protein [Deltaproteobacteria bacterium]